jgi:hypothetical protein
MPWERSPGRLGGLQSCTERVDEEINSQPPPRIEPYDSIIQAVAQLYAD